jgi:hypothetical protein
MAIALGDLLGTNSAADADEATAMFTQALHWARSASKLSRSRTMRELAANAEFRLGVCRFEQDRIEEAIPLVQHAAAEFRQLSLDFPSDLQYVKPARQAQETLIEQLQQSGRTEEAKVATREMTDWLDATQARQKDAMKAPENENPERDKSAQDILRQPPPITDD